MRFLLVNGILNFHVRRYSRRIVLQISSEQTLLAPRDETIRCIR